jgi:hypothetical protein
MESVKYVLFANHTATGSIYQTVAINTENYKNLQFWFCGPKNSGVGGSATIWFEHCTPESIGATWENFPAMVILGAGGATMSNRSLRSSYNITSSTGGSMIAGYIDTDFIPAYVRVKYELSGVAASASAGTISAWMIGKREVIT